MLAKQPVLATDRVQARCKDTTVLPEGEGEGKGEGGTVKRCRRAMCCATAACAYVPWHLHGAAARLRVAVGRVRSNLGVSMAHLDGLLKRVGRRLSLQDVDEQRVGVRTQRESADRKPIYTRIAEHKLDESRKFRLAERWKG